MGHWRTSIPTGWEVANCLKISGGSETGNEEEPISHLKFCGEGKPMGIGLSARNWARNSGMLRGLRRAREAFCGQTWADGQRGCCFASEAPVKSLMHPELGEWKAPCRCRAVFTSLTHPRFVLLRVRSTCVKFLLFFLF